MKVRCRLLLLPAIALVALPVRAVYVNGRSYTALSEWAAVNNFHLQAKRGEIAIYTNPVSRLVVEKDSRTAQINGVNVALSFPAALDKGVMLLSQLDLVKTIDPLVFTPNFAGKKISTICIDPGHGGKDTGNHTGSQNEKTCTLLLAQELGDQLKSCGFNIVLTRTKDKFVELTERSDIANRRGADLLVSLHFNATESSKAEVSGLETYCITPVSASSSNAEGKGAGYGATPANVVERKSLLLAYQVQKSLVRTLAAEDRSVRRARFAVLREAEMPSILIESGYLTHPVEGKKIADPAYRRQIAAAIVKGILNYQRLTAPPAPPAAVAGKVAGARKTK